MENQFQIQLNYQTITNFHVHTKHIDVCYHFICEAIENKSLDIQYVPTNENIVDIFTKALARLTFKKFREMLGLCYTWGGVLE